jgi:hypothetical protein
MEDDKKRTKEYYQVNLDTGRIFWIVFVIGIIVIGIFFLGIYLGRDKEDNKLFGFDRSKFLKREDVSGTETVSVETSEEDTPILKLLEEDLDDESRYIEIEEIPVPVGPQAVQKAEPATGVKETAVRPDRVRAEKKPAIKKAAPASSPPYIAKGDYFIQIASFTKRENADTMAEDLRKRLYKVIIVEAPVDEKTFYRVRVGPFETEGVAKNTMISMKRQFNLKDPFVVKKSS